MSRLPLVEPDSATGEVAEMLTAVKARLGRVTNMVRVMAGAPAVLKSYIALTGALGQGSLSRQTAERLALAVSEANGCTLCLSAHTALGGKAGLSSEEIIAARRGTSADPKEAAALVFARTLLASGGNATDEDLATLRSAGYSDADVLEIIAHISLSVLTNYVNKVARTPIDFPEAAPLA